MDRVSDAMDRASDDTRTYRLTLDQVLDRNVPHAEQWLDHCAVLDRRWSGGGVDASMPELREFVTYLQEHLTPDLRPNVASLLWCAQMGLTHLDRDVGPPNVIDDIALVLREDCDEALRRAILTAFVGLVWEQRASIKPPILARRRASGAYEWVSDVAVYVALLLSGVEGAPSHWLCRRCGTSLPQYDTAAWCTLTREFEGFESPKGHKAPKGEAADAHSHAPRAIVDPLGGENHGSTLNFPFRAFAPIFGGTVDIRSTLVHFLTLWRADWKEVFTRRGWSSSRRTHRLLTEYRRQPQHRPTVNDIDSIFRCVVP